ncbi:MAG: hypothetical protein QXG44_12485 [Candidatus Jordarchaeaceae archaeon]
MAETIVKNQGPYINIIKVLRYTLKNSFAPSTPMPVVENFSKIRKIVNLSHKLTFETQEQHLFNAEKGKEKFETVPTQRNTSSALSVCSKLGCFAAPTLLGGMFPADLHKWFCLQLITAALNFKYFCLA